MPQVSQNFQKLLKKPKPFPKEYPLSIKAKKWAKNNI